MMLVGRVFVALGQRGALTSQSFRTVVVFFNAKEILGRYPTRTASN